MAKKLGKPNSRGLYRTEKGEEVIYLGTEKQEAERRKAIVESLFSSLGEKWTPLGLLIAKALGKGQTTLVVEPPAEYVDKPDLLARSLQYTQAKYPCIKLSYDGDIDLDEGQKQLNAMHDKAEEDAAAWLAEVKAGILGAKSCMPPSTPTATMPRPDTFPLTMA